MDNKSNPPPPYGFNPQQPPQPQVQVVYAASPPRMAALGPDSCTTQCPSCHATVSTRTEKEPTMKTHLFALILCLVFCPCVVVPYCTDCCKATNHYCPSCGAFLGSYDM